MALFTNHVKRAIAEPVTIAAYDPAWPRQFEQEVARLRDCLPADRIGRIEHFGSTAVPGLAAKPIIDMLVEVRSLREVMDHLAPILEARGYEFFWRPSTPGGLDVAYTWFIRRDSQGRRTHHLHMLTPDSPEWERLLFRDYLIAHPDVAREYAEVKRASAQRHGDERIAYARDKGDFIGRVMAQARAQRNGRAASG